MSSQPAPTDHFGMNVNDLLVLPEIQGFLKRDTSNNEFVPTTASDTGIRDTVAESQRDDIEEMVQVQEQDPGERHQRQPLYNFLASKDFPSSALVLPTEVDKTKELESKTPGISPIDSGSPTAKVVHEICAIEREDLCRQTEVLTTSLKRRKRDNMDVTHQQCQLQESRSELCRLLEIEAQLKEYEKRSVESLEVEFQMLQQEVVSLSDSVEAARQEEIDWVA
ncbi:unnamed protein product [Peronospora destructor]|uniref:Uncharacterized protein n=1 Tax=Peronospora destructor TaxID=86335 RepID=A0AAV0V021_9STRA|nr:unnamed protein product [Peronospora destructor]